MMPALHGNQEARQCETWFGANSPAHEADSTIVPSPVVGQCDQASAAWVLVFSSYSEKKKQSVFSSMMVNPQIVRLTSVPDPNHLPGFLRGL